MALLLGVATAAAQDAPREFAVRPLECALVLPAGWTGDEGATGLAARDPNQNGFVVTREPFLHDPETFAAAWQAQLANGKISATVERTKALGRDAWRAAWTAGDRRIEVWRVHAPECEMLYNLSFSGGPGFDLKAVIEATLKSFKCTAPKAELKFQQNTEAVTTRISLRLPEGYAKEETAEGIALGGGLSGGFVKTLPGYDPPHVAGRIRFAQHESAVTYGTPAGRIPGGDTEKWLAYAWQADERELGAVAKKPRPGGATFCGIKGDAMEACVVAKNGLPQRWMGFVGKYKQDVVTIVVIVDEREARLHKDYLKQVCSNFVIAK